MTIHDTDIVSTLRLLLAERIGQERFGLWFGATTRMEVDRGVLSVAVPDRFTLDWLRKGFRADLEAVCTEAIGESAVVQFHVDERLRKADGQGPDAESATADGQGADNDGPHKSTSTTRRRRRFACLETFEVADCNRVAFTSADMVARQLGAVSPLFVYGPSGSGKTHLLEGIWTAVRRQSQTARCVYLRAEQFTSFFLEALQGSGLPSFRRKYRQADLLILDDVHFFAGKRATLVELQHTLDALLCEGRQIVLAADRSPGRLTALGPELMTRLSGGLVCGVDYPDRAARLNVLKRWAIERHVQVPRGVLQWVASQLPGDVRQLSGAVNRLQATCLAEGRPITRELAEKALGELIQSTRRVVNLGDIERAVCDTFGLEPRTLKSQRKTRSVSYPRMLAMWLARKYTRAALAEIGDFFGHRSHSTVISAGKNVDRWVSDGRSLLVAQRECGVADVISRIEESLRTG